jgi:hypothetical protein
VTLLLRPLPGDFKGRGPGARASGRRPSDFRLLTSGFHIPQGYQGEALPSWASRPARRFYRVVVSGVRRNPLGGMFSDRVTVTSVLEFAVAPALTGAAGSRGVVTCAGGAGMGRDVEAGVDRFHRVVV